MLNLLKGNIDFFSFFFNYIVCLLNVVLTRSPFKETQYLKITGLIYFNGKLPLVIIGNG
jgi:hypothetical protein